MMRVGVVLLGAIPLILAGCAPKTEAPPKVVGGDAQTTPAALAYVAAEYLGAPEKAQERSDMLPEFGVEPLQAELLFGSTGEHAGESVQVVVGREFRSPITDCSTPGYNFNGCEAINGGVWFWVDSVPEMGAGGKGGIGVIQRKGDATVTVVYGGLTIEGDPREADLPVEVKTLIDLAADPRVDLTTSEAAVKGGADATYWHD